MENINEVVENDKDDACSDSSTGNKTGESIAQIESSLADVKGKLLKRIREKKIYSFIFTLSAVLITIHYFVHGGIFSLWVQVVMWIVAVFFGLAILGTDTGELESKVSSWESLRKFYFGTSDAKQTYFDSLVQINVTNLDAYYLLVKRHTQLSFRFSAIVGFVGFSLLVYGLSVSFVKPDSNQITYLASGAGIITEFISGVFFYLHSKTVRQLKDYHDSLLDVQNILLSFKLIEATKDEKSQIDMTNKMIEFLVGKGRDQHSE